MAFNLPSYSDYRNSGLLWLGELPAHWRVATVRRYCRVFAGATPSRAVPEYWANGSIPWLSSGDVNQRRIRKANQFITNEGYAATSTRWIRPGSVVVALAGQGRTKGMVATVEIAATSNQSLSVLEPTPHVCDFRFLAYYLESRYQEIRGLVGDGLRDGLNLEHVKSFPTPLPPLDEQLSIVRFLDYSDRLIRGYVQVKKKLIALLNELNQAIIDCAITRGLDSYPSLRRTGIKWLEEIPEDWEIRQLRRLMRRGRRITYGIVQPGEPDPLGRYMVRGQDYSAGWAKPETLFRVSAAIEEPYRRSRLLAGDLVMTIVGAGVGNIAMVPAWLDGSNITQTTARLSVDPSKAEPEFVALALQSMVGRRNVELYVKGAAQPGLNLEHVRMFQIPVPPSDQQKEIVEATRRSTASQDAAIGKASIEIAKLLEYRTRLIADLVTGRLDVREAATRLPLQEVEVAPDDGASIRAGEEAGAIEPEPEPYIEELEA